MAKINLKSILFYAAVVLIGLLAIFIGNKYVDADSVVFANNVNNTNVVRAKVDYILSKKDTKFVLGLQEKINSEIFFEATIKSGEKKGESVFATQIIDSMMAIPLREIDEGDNILIAYTAVSGEQKIWLMTEYDRSQTIATLSVVFMLLLLAFGKKKGLGTVFSLILTCLFIFIVFVPAIMAGFNIYTCTYLVCIFTVIITLLLVNGPNIKSLSAGFGTVGGLVISGIIFSLCDSYLKLTGMVDEDMVFLMNLNPQNPINLKAIIFASVLIGVLGAALDVGVSIASSLAEIKQISPDIDFKSLVKSGFNVGRDILGTMSNTLILVYIGGALPITILLVSYSASFIELINREVIVVEILQSIIGSIGLLFTIPITTLFYAAFVTRKKSGTALSSSAQSVEDINSDI